ncbi:type I secretion membrane fusion, HlyD family protein [Sphingomonas sp. S17]|jgi:HlyD family secretion protein|uniref:Membrane fusion protein (MFP) family protein n=2 Tax=Sphingomonas paucimobilis TaxID=13689 RepID=A0A411LLD5_SPHPI|nr:MULTISPECIES: HlyD family type I secretion periplasmic adaptor subunit [Sphingomonas]EGI55596.1 type I secretion membrane fusion, HlyD family protein [Sphingomonas sp. S17]MBQ1481901.1 HlyD family type I secretion periplasmic adaptor subunit [Sphingomonas sp.]MCM3680190.1 HlyD family type I secretion periplasmic adaptor subunit [Sphingomonas paucimobilis]MDG5970382.1 HlyD family type I secretion periplasmic adaptor subunit [Sphingomonas paucimobilis]NNG58371.1 HlyD family type I secretion p
MTDSARAQLADRLHLDDSPRRAIRVGAIVAFLFFVVGLGWAALARLDAAAAGEGQVTVSGNRRTVQHRDGGIVKAMLVRDGEHVRAGQILFRLEGAEVAASERALAASVIDLQAQRARLEAEIAGHAIVWPADFATATGDDRRLVERAKALQLAQLRSRNAALAASDQVLRQQAAEVGKQTTGYNAQADATARQRASLMQQLESTRKLADEGYVSRNTVRAIERSIQQLEGADADYSSRSAAAREQIGQTRAQMVQTRRRQVEEAATALRDTQFQLNEMLPKWAAARDQLARTEIRAPVSGRVVGLRVFTVGGVIQAGQPILDIVPDAAPLIVRANFAPGDIDGVIAGRPAEVKFLSLHDRGLPILAGTVRSVSADSLRDEASGRSYFTAEIAVPREQIARIAEVRGGDTGIRAGVPVAVTVPLRPRSALQYLLDPLTETFARSFHER